MKKIILLLILSGAIVKNAGAQTTPITDTLTYLQHIVNTKANYIGQPFSVLLNSLQLQIKFFSPFAGSPYAKSKETSTSFAFNFPQTPEDMYLTYPGLEIYWLPNLNADQSNLLYTQFNGGGWSPTVAAFYSTAIISDIKIRD